MREALPTPSSSLTPVREGAGKASALAILLAAGLLLGITTNLPKIAAGAGFSPLAYLVWSLIGATGILLAHAFSRGVLPVLNRRSLEYFVIAGFLTTAGANLIFFSAVPHLGVSFIALLLALPPLLTYAGALMLGMERFCRWRASGVLLALSGTGLLVARQWSAADAQLMWVGVALLGPLMLAGGNLYRSWRWPPGASPESLAPGMLVAATAILLIYAFSAGAGLALPTSVNAFATVLVVVQAAIFAGQFLLMFKLQQAGGPVFLSLMGGVSAVFGVPIAMVLLAEPALPGMLPSALLVATGIACLLRGTPQRA